MPSLEKLKNVAAIAAQFLPRNPLVATESAYNLLTDLFDAISENSGMINLGHRAARPGIRAAQETLCLMTLEGFDPEGHWLDVGCGHGGPALFLAAHFPQVRITGINITRRHLEVANARARALGLQDRVRFIYGNACEMPFSAGERFDGVYAIETAFHYPDKAAFVRESARVLKPTGRFACADLVVEPAAVGPIARLCLPVVERFMACPGFFSSREYLEALSDAALHASPPLDITPHTLGMLDLWARQVRKHTPELAHHYPVPYLLLTAWAFQSLSEHLETLPIRYVLVRADRAADEAGP